MIKKLQSVCALLLLFSLGAAAQSGTIKGKIIDKATNEPLPFASVVAEMSGTTKGSSASDFDGEYTIKPLEAGEYTVKVSYVGYNDLVITGVVVSIDKITFQDLTLSKKVVETQEVEIVAYKVPLIDKGNPAVQSTVTREEIETAPTRDVRSVAATAAGVFQKDEGDDLNIRGQRTEATDYYIDGVRVRGSKKLPQAGVEQVTVVTGGVPAQYGDNTGGVISITTRGPSQEYSAGLELVTSELFDQYGYNLASLNVSGPIAKKRGADGAPGRTLLGFFVSGEVQFEKDPDPSAIGMYKLKDDVYEGLKNNPVIPQLNDPNAQGSAAYGSVEKGEFLHRSDFEKTKVKQNVDQLGYRFTAKLDFQPTVNTGVTIGGSFDRNDRSSFLYDRSVYNFAENPQIIDTDYRVFLRLTQKVASTMASEKENAGLLRNVYFSIQGEYSKNQLINQDEAHEKNFWRYGYIGKFSANRFVDRNLNPSNISIVTDSVGIQTTIVDYDFANHYSYTPGGMNPEGEAYTNTATNFLNNIYSSGLYSQANLQTLGLYGVNSYQDLSIITSSGGLVNGSSVSNVFAMWNNIGNPRNLYQETDNDQFRVAISGNADIKDHELSLGFEFEQRIDRGFQFRPVGLWSVGRQQVNRFDRLQQVYVNDPAGVINDTLIRTEVDVYTNPSGVETFYERIRNDLGIPMNQYIDFDALNPDELKVEWFDPEDLINPAILQIYYGYDYTGEKFTGNPSFKDFFTKRENGVLTREIGAFKPTYMAGYIQDKFAIESLIFNVGLRVDRFDANQKQLKDKYLLNEAYTVGNYPVAIGDKPGNIGDDFIPYLSSNNVNDIIGYRDGDVWYDAEGQIVTNPDLLAQQTSSGTIIPALVNPKPIGENWEIDQVFEDYEPQYSIMPRIAFSFPISDEALFFAHYDVLTQRPSGRLRTDPLEYLALATIADAEINNGALKPEKTTDYEVGFRQVLSRSSAISISAFYRELKNLIQVRKLYHAYPNTYRSYDNIDFGTVKGLSLSYDLRRTNNVRLTASYQLQFAEGTGSGDRSNIELVDTDQPNLRILAPLDFDQRHTLVASVDYRYGTGADYNGPVWFGKQVFSNAGINFTTKANSGTPYTRQSRATQEANAIGWQDNGQRAVEGGVNQGRTPWRFTIDLRLNKEFQIKTGGKRPIGAEVYVLVQNLLDSRNVIAVYRATGNPDDDAYLASVEGQFAAASQDDPQAFIDQYNIKMLNPDNYSLPRRARLGVNFNF